MKINEQFCELEIIKENHNKKISLVRSQIDHLLYIKKELLTDNYNVYLQLQQLNSPYIPKIEQVKREENKIIIIEEYINAPTLEEVLLNEQLDKETILSIFIDICLAVNNLHQLEPPLIHRDIKPSNIFCNGKRIYLFDFDISRNFQNNKNKDTQILGSIGYAAPEQFGFGQSSVQSDIYALGVLLNVMLTSKLPNDLLYQGKESKIIKKATSLDPQNRYLSVQQLLNELEIKTNAVIYKNIIKDLPGFRNNSKLKKGLAGFCYLILLTACLDTEVTIEGAPVNDLIIFLNRFCFFVFCLIIVLVAGNYKEIQKRCLFAKNKYWLVRFSGIILSTFAMLVLEVVVFSFILSIVSNVCS